MNKIKIIALLLFIIGIFSFLHSSVIPSVFATNNTDGNIYENYIIYDEYGKKIIEKSQVFEGDYFIGENLNKYEIIKLNNEHKTGVARFVEKVVLPKVTFSPQPTPINLSGKLIGLYCTHNDESYLPSDGYYTIYGKGGVHDIANEIKATFQNSGVQVQFNESLHLPHDSKAYSRSIETAKQLLKNDKINAIFDIHRDGAARAAYATKYDGQERSQVRIVVGKSNPNMKVNEQFALYLMSVANELYPWLIKDIYYASGHYNQALFDKALLFEMGTYTIEKELVKKSVEPLVEVINTALFNTTVNTKTGELEIGGATGENVMLVDDALSGETIIGGKTLYDTLYIIIYAGLIIIAILLLNIVVLTAIKLFKNRKLFKQ